MSMQSCPHTISVDIEVVGLLTIYGTERTLHGIIRMIGIRLAYLFQQTPEDDSLVTSLMIYPSCHMVTQSQCCQ